MLVIVPESITAAKLTSSNVVAEDVSGILSAWSNIINYTTVGLRVVYQNLIYENLQTSNTNNIPSSSPTFWLSIGATNKFRMFDGKVSSVSRQASTIDVTITPGIPITGVALFNIIADTVRLIGNTPSAGNFYDETIELQNYDNVQNAFDYFFADVSERLKNDITFSDIPGFGGATYQIILDNGSETAQCGECVIGRLYELGATLENAQISIRDFSKKEVDDFGDFTIVQRGYRKEGVFDVVIDQSRIGFVRRFFEERRTTPLIFIGSNLSDETVIYGFYSNFRSIIGNPEQARYSINIEGLT
jgi:hypothetical protein